MPSQAFGETSADKLVEDASKRNGCFAFTPMEAPRKERRRRRRKGARAKPRRMRIRTARAGRRAVQGRSEEKPERENLPPPPETRDMEGLPVGGAF